MIQYTVQKFEGRISKCFFLNPKKNPKKSLTGPKHFKAAQIFPTLIINQHIRMISEGPRDTEYLSIDAENSALPHKLYFKVYSNRKL